MKPPVTMISTSGSRPIVQLQGAAGGGVTGEIFTSNAEDSASSNVTLW